MSHRLESLSNQTIYEIFRACRLCGSGAGYKMPIIQNILGIESNDMELPLKIRDCVQIEVKEDDKMPPLICELCIGKVNDFYDFLDMCRQTNKRTRLRLGLPPQTMAQEAPDSDDCILGVTEQICPKTNPVNPIRKPGPKSLKHTLVRTVKINRHDSDRSVQGKKEVEWSIKGNDEGEGRKVIKEERDIKGKKHEKDGKGKKDEKDRKGGSRWQKELQDLKIQTERSKLDNSVSSRSSRQEPRSSSVTSRSSRSRIASPPTRSAAGNSKPSVSSRLRHQEPQKETEKHKQIQLPLKSILKKEIKKEPLSDEESLLVPRAKRAREKDVVILEPPYKKTKQSAARKPSPPPKVSSKPATKSTKPPPPPPTPPPPPNICSICDLEFKSVPAMMSHMRIHKDTKPTHSSRPSVPVKAEPEARSPAGDRLVSKGPLRHHKCGPQTPPSKQQCGNCRKFFAAASSLCKHQKKCSKKVPAAAGATKTKIDAKVRRQLKPLQVRVARCDPILRRRRGRYVVSGVPALFGLDKRCVYPFSRGGLRIKSEPLHFDGMVSIQQEIRDEFYKEEEYVHWDSDLSTDSEDELDTTGLDVNPLAKNKVRSLTTLSLKTIFSKRCIGKVPRKLRKVKSEKLFDSLFNASELENDVSFNNNINNIIGSLDDGDDNATVNWTGGEDSNVRDGTDAVANVDYDSDLLLEEQDKDKVRVSNSDFDTLFKSNHLSHNNDRDVNNHDDAKVSTENGEEETQVKNDDVGIDKEVADKGSPAGDKKDNDTLSLNSQISDKTEYDSVSQNGDLNNSGLGDKIGNNDNSEVMVEDCVKSGKENGKSNHDDIISSGDENRLFDVMIGGIEAKSNEFSSSVREKGEKLTLDDVVSNKDELKSLDLDNVSDEEFNFDV